MFSRIKTIFIGYVLWIWYYLYKPYRDKRKDDAKKRMKICEECKYFKKSIGTCKICKCIMTVKTKMYFPLDKNGISHNGCLKKYW